MINQGRDVLAPLAQGGGLYREDVKAIEQVLAEQAVFHGLGGVAVGGRDDTHIDLQRALGAHCVDLAFLQDAQQFNLHI